MRIEYQTALTQQGHVTHVDARWIGKAEWTDDKAIGTCPDLHVYLKEVGAEGWALCATIPLAQGQATQLVFRRPG
jgi:hypothetical protein